MNPMLITYIVTGFCILFAISSIMYFTKNKRFIGRSPIITIAAILVGVMGVFATVKGIPINQVQFLIESMFR